MCNYRDIDENMIFSNGGLDEDRFILQNILAWSLLTWL